MKQNVCIRIKGTQSVDGEKGVTETTARGTLERTAAGLRLCYEEVSESGERENTVLTLIGQTVSITKNGGNGMRMTIQKGQHRSCTYPSPLGTLRFGTFGTDILHENAVLKLAYELYTETELMSCNELEITYTIE